MTGRAAHHAVTRVLSLLMAAIGVALIVQAAGEHGSVLSPRLLLVLFELSRTRGVVEHALRGDEWNAYAGHVMSQVDGKGAPVCVLSHGLPLDELVRDRWRQWARARPGISSISSCG